MFLSMWFACTPGVAITDSKILDEDNGQPSSEDTAELVDSDTGDTASTEDNPDSGDTDSGNTDSGNTDSGNTDSGDTEEPIDPCDSAVPVTIDIQIPGTVDCNWYNDGNQAPTQSIYSGRTEQAVSVVLADDELFCDADFSFTTSQNGLSGYFAYDDHFLFVMNEHILASSGTDVEQFSTYNGISYLYDWNDYKGNYIDMDVSPWAPGNSSLDFPNSGFQGGNASMTIDDQVVDDVFALSIQSRQVDFKVITFGDNDNGDCYHSGLFFPVTFYIGLTGQK